MLKRGLLITICLLLSGCGFQLRDAYQIPPSMQQLALDYPQFSAFGEAFQQRLELAGVVLDPSSDTRIEVLDDALDRRTLSLSASGQVAEYELIYQVRYQLLQSNRAPQVFQLEVFRDYQDDPNFALAKSREREILVQEMRVEAARRALLQLINELTETPTQP